jgi:hypothetical protein
MGLGGPRDEATPSASWNSEIDPPSFVFWFNLYEMIGNHCGYVPFLSRDICLLHTCHRDDRFLYTNHRKRHGVSDWLVISGYRAV